MDRDPEDDGDVRTLRDTLRAPARHLGRLAGSETSHAELARLLAGVLQFLAVSGFLSTSDFGRLAVLYFFASVLAPLFTVSATMVVVRRAAAGEAPSILLRHVALASLTATAVGVAVVLGLAAAGVAPADAPVAAGVVASELLGATLLQGTASVMQGRLEFGGFRTVVILTASARIAAVGVFVVFTQHTLGAWAACIFGVMTVCGVAVVLRYAWAWRHRPGTEARGPAIGRHEGLILGLNALSVRVLDDADKAILALFRDYATVGRYAVAFRVASYILFPSRAVLAKFMPRIFRAGGGTPEALRDLVVRARRELLAAVLLTSPVLAGCAVVLPLILGDRYAASTAMALALIPLLALRGIHWIYGDVLIALGRARSRVIAQAISVVLPVACYFVLIPLLGAWGAVLATGVGELITIACMRRFAHRALARHGESESSPASGVEAASRR